MMRRYLLTTEGDMQEHERGFWCEVIEVDTELTALRERVKELEEDRNNWLEAVQEMAVLMIEGSKSITQLSAHPAVAKLCMVLRCKEKAEQERDDLKDCIALISEERDEARKAYEAVCAQVKDAENAIARARRAGAECFKDKVLATMNLADMTHREYDETWIYALGAIRALPLEVE